MSRSSSSFTSRFIHYKKGSGRFLYAKPVLSSFYSFLVFSFLVIFSTNIGPRSKKWADFYGLQRSHQHFLPFLLLIWFYAILPNVPSDLPPVFTPSKKLFPGINEDFFYTCILGFFCGCPLGAKIINDLILSWFLYQIRKVRQASYMFAIRSVPMFTAGYTSNFDSPRQTLILFVSFSVCIFLSLCYLFYLVFIYFSQKIFFMHITILTSCCYTKNRLIR